MNGSVETTRIFEIDFIINKVWIFAGSGTAVPIVAPGMPHMWQMGTNATGDTITLSTLVTFEDT